jgi:hypothetical protein
MKFVIFALLLIASAHAGPYSWSYCSGQKPQLIDIQKLTIVGDIKKGATLTVNFEGNMLKSTTVTEGKIVAYIGAVKLIDKKETLSYATTAGPVTISKQFTIPKVVGKGKYHGEVSVYDATGEIECVDFLVQVDK